MFDINNSIYNEALTFASNHSNVSGVNSIIEEIKNDYVIYCNEISELKNDKYDLVVRREMNALNFKKAKLIFIFLWVISFIIPFFIKNRFIQELFMLFCIFLFFVMLLFIILSKITKHQYSSICSDVSYENKKIFDKHESTIHRLRKKADDLYLASLDPTHREIVLLRRDQAARNQREVALLKENLRLQEDIKNSQDETKTSINELLQIERDRENRRRY